jgi:hypothetical protein
VDEPADCGEFAKLPEVLRKPCRLVMKNCDSVIVITERIVTLCGDSKAAGAWAIPTALPSSPTRMPFLSGRHPLGIETGNCR